MVCTGAVSFVCGAYACSTNGKEALLTMDEHMHISHEMQILFAALVSGVLSAQAKAEVEDPDGDPLFETPL